MSESRTSNPESRLRSAEERDIPAIVALVTFVLTAKCRHLNDFRAKVHVRETKAPADQTTVTEQFFYVFRRGIRGHIKVFRLAAK